MPDLLNEEFAAKYQNERRYPSYFFYNPKEYIINGGSVNRYIFREAFKDIIPKSLYTLNVKSENSREAEKRPDDWFESYKKSKEETVSFLDEAVWSRYLSYDVIRKWLEALSRQRGKKEEEMDDMRIMYLLTQCAKAQNALEVAKGKHN